MSTRSLQRRLREKGLAYRDLVDRVRHDQAVIMLAETGIPFSEIARHLGYRDAANFNHAFRRCTGTSPSGYQKALRG